MWSMVFNLRDHFGILLILVMLLIIYVSICIAPWSIDTDTEHDPDT
jgi:hypothetical protein